MDSQVYTAEHIVKKRIRKGEVQYYVKWRGWGSKHNTWEPKEHIIDTSLIDVFEEKHTQTYKKSNIQGLKFNTQNAHIDTPKKPTPRKNEHEIADGTVPDNNIQDEVDLLESMKNVASLLPKSDDKTEEDKQIDDGLKILKLITTVKKDLVGEKIKDKNRILNVKINETQQENKLPPTGEKSSSPLYLSKPHKVKRKLKVVSKRSGKVGATITASAHISKCKVPKIQSSLNGQDTNNSPLTQDDTRILKRKSSEHGKSSNQNYPASGNQHYSVLQSTLSVNSRDTVAVASISSKTSGDLARSQEEAKTAIRQGTRCQHQTLDIISVDKNHTQRLQYKAILTNPGPEYCLAPNPIKDNIIITDVTVNLVTVTIKECKTAKGFFNSNVKARF